VTPVRQHIEQLLTTPTACAQEASDFRRFTEARRGSSKRTAASRRQYFPFINEHSRRSSMDRLNGAAAAALLISLALSGCGGGSSDAAAAGSGASNSQSIQGVSTPSSVSVVTAKNAS